MRCPAGLHTHPAELIFIERSPVYLTGRYRDERNRLAAVMHSKDVARLYGTWTGRLLNHQDAHDSADSAGRYRGLTATIYEIDSRTPGETRFLALSAGPDAGSRRYATFESLTAAQAHLVRWAGRRFRIPCPLYHP
jgi:hypothetical protein